MKTQQTHADNVEYTQICCVMVIQLFFYEDKFINSVIFDYPDIVGPLPLHFVGALCKRAVLRS